MGHMYITRLTMAKCERGTQPRPLMIANDHGVIYHNPQLPLLNANDHMPDVNILSYGNCAGPMDQSGIRTPCRPDTADQAWKNVNERYIIDGAPALMETSTLTCKVGGTITIDVTLPITMDPPPEGATGNGGK